MPFYKLSFGFEAFVLSGTLLRQKITSGYSAARSHYEKQSIFGADAERRCDLLGSGFHRFLSELLLGYQGIARYGRLSIQRGRTRFEWDPFARRRFQWQMFGERDVRDSIWKFYSAWCSE
jgi:hypothetical protein